MTEDRIIRHRTLPIEAPLAMWVAFGWETYTNTDVAGRRPWDDNADQLLAIAVAKGLTGAQALAFAVEERQRQNEEQRRASVVCKEAEAIAALASSLRTESDRSVVQRIMSRLSERTQWALRSQLKGTGLLPE